MTTTTDRSELLANLSEGIAKLTTSDEWQRYPDCQSRFYRFSPNKVMLIAQQRDEAMVVAGFNAWKKHGRFVRKGEKAIWTLAPMVYKASADEDSDDNERVIRGLKLVPAFDTPPRTVRNFQPSVRDSQVTILLDSSPDSPTSPTPSASLSRMQSFPVLSTETALTSCTPSGSRSPTHPHSG
jgi:hypothetical protein